MQREVTKNPLFKGNKHKYVAVSGASSTISMEDEDEDESVEISLQSPIESSDQGASVQPKSNSSLMSLWNTLTFAWVRPLLELGNQRALEQTDLFALNSEDTAVGVYATFVNKWRKELTTSKPSVAMALMLAFGSPFMGAGFLKLIHDSCLFVSPLMLNKLIYFLSDPDES